VQKLWGKLEKEDDGQMDRLKCWGALLVDAGLAALVGHSDAATGKTCVPTQLNLPGDPCALYVALNRSAPVAPFSNSQVSLKR